MKKIYIYRKTKIKSSESLTRRYYIFNIPVLDITKKYSYPEDKVKVKFKDLLNYLVGKDKSISINTVFNRRPEGDRVFYLKIHREHPTSLDCIQHWIDIANRLNSIIYFVCDKPWFQKEVEDVLNLNTLNYRFITSDRNTLSKEIDIILSKNIKYGKELAQRC